MKKLVEGKIALVTGGGAGMGACDCWKFAEEGAKGILIVDLNVDDAEKVAKEIMAQYPECKCVVNLFTLAVRICGVLFLIPQFGILGYLWALLASQLLTFGCCIFLLIKQGR